MNDLRRDVAALADHYGLPAVAAEALVAFGLLVVEVDDERFAKREWRVAPSARLATSLAALELEAVRRAERIADVGSGIGFPGLVLAAALRDTRVALIEPEANRCEFLRRTTAALRLANVEIVETRVEKWEEGVEAYDVVTSRGLAELRGMVKKAAPLVGPDGTLVLWGRAKRDAAWEAGAESAAAARGLRLETIHRTQPPITKGRFLYVFEKNAAGSARAE